MGQLRVTTGGTQSGVGLVEVLIALVVFTIGILGTFTAQITAKKANFEAAQQSIATNMARDIFARMRSNQSQIAAYVIEEAGAHVVPMVTDCRLAPCSSGELAAFDLVDWTSRLAGAFETISIDDRIRQTGGLVLPRACIRNNAGTVSVSIAWRGVSKLVSRDGSDCGGSSGLYGPGNEQRRLLVMTSYFGLL